MSSTEIKVNQEEAKILDMMIFQAAKDLVNSSKEIQTQGLDILRRHFWLARSIKFAKSGLMCFKMDYCQIRKRKIASLVHLPSQTAAMKKCDSCENKTEINSGKVIIDLMNQLTDIQQEYTAFVKAHK